MLISTQDECMPAEELYHAQVEKGAKRWQVIPPVIEDLKRRAKQLGLWNLFLSKRHYPEWGTDLTNLEYGVMAEVMGRAGHFASEACNCAAPDTGNMGACALARVRRCGALIRLAQRCWPSTATRSSRSGGSSRCSPARSARESRLVCCAAPARNHSPVVLLAPARLP